MFVFYFQNSNPSDVVVVKRLFEGQREHTSTCMTNTKYRHSKFTCQFKMHSDPKEKQLTLECNFKKCKFISICPLLISQLGTTDLLSFCVIQLFSSLVAMSWSTLLASFAKSRSRTSCGDTGTMAKASLSSFMAAHPTYRNIIQNKCNT